MYYTDWYSPRLPSSFFNIHIWNHLNKNDKSNVFDKTKAKLSVYKNLNIIRFCNVFLVIDLRRNICIFQVGDV